MSHNSNNLPPLFTRMKLRQSESNDKIRDALTVRLGSDMLRSKLDWSAGAEAQKYAAFLEICLAILELSAQPNRFFVTRPKGYLVSILERDRNFASVVAGVFRIYYSSVYEGNNSTYRVWEDYLEPIAAYMCNEPPPPEEDPPAVNSSDASRLIEKAVVNAWETPLTGYTDVRLLDHIKKDHAAAAAKHYSNTVTMVQSSGTGKSRAARELRRFMFAIGLVLRQPGLGGSEYPPSDDKIHNMMTKVADLEDELSAELLYRARYRKMLDVFFRHARGWLQQQSWTETKQPRAYLEKAQAWDMFLSHHKAEAYASVADEVNSWESELIVQLKKLSLENQKLALEGGASNVDSLKEAMSALRTELERTSATVRVGPRLPLPPPPFAHQLARTDITGLRSGIDQALRRWRAGGFSDHSLEPAANSFVFLATFDEAHTLFLSRTVGGRTQYDSLLSVFNDLQRDTFAIFLSTSSHLRMFAPPAALSSSDRQARSGHLQPPITELPFDCYHEKVGLNSGLTVATVSTVRFMARFGRPLFWTLMRGYDNLGEIDKASLSSQVLHLAQAKLINSELTQSDNWKDASRDAWIAVLDFRLCMRFETRKAASDLLERLVASHLRLVYSVVKSREHSVSGFSSEPLIGEAAAQQMREWTRSSVTGEKRPDRWNDVELLSTLMMSDNLLDRGERGELTARLLLIRAYDDGMHLHHKGRARNWLYSAGCPVNRFFRALFAANIWSTIMNVKADDVPDSAPLQEKFKDSLVRFTHFARLGDKSGLSTKGLAAAFIRCVAFIGCTNQALVDLIIPVLLDSTKPISPENMSAILIQVKRRMQAGTAAEYNFTAEDLEIFKDSDPAGTPDPKGLKQRAYCTLVMELAVSHRKPMTAADAPRRSPRGHTPPRHPRYSFRVYGCSDTTYNVIDPKENEALTAIILATSTWASEHPRTTLIDCVWRMLIEWTAKYAYDWLDDPPAGEPEPDNDFKGYAEVGSPPE